MRLSRERRASATFWDRRPGHWEQRQLRLRVRDHAQCVHDRLHRGPVVRGLPLGELAALDQAGFVRSLTPLDYLHRYWRQVSTEERLRFLTEMLTPNERRPLQLGFEEMANDIEALRSTP